MVDKDSLLKDWCDRKLILMSVTKNGVSDYELAHFLSNYLINQEYTPVGNNVYYYSDYNKCYNCDEEIKWIKNKHKHYNVMTVEQAIKYYSKDTGVFPLY